MYVEQIILEGFKTYMNRTVISGFDPQFNAITGLNGSGKSNILDAIQFLLGSTSKEMLRLKTGLTELIYKEGFAGIEKASVTIKFRCKEKHMRPTGYQNCEELIVTRQITKDKITKFFVNGQNSNLSKVKNMFRTVQLNIQNPHFLVKQGQITKIINLKPLQLLGMIEQTAGTAYYNKTRSESEKIIQRKEQKLESINEILQTTIRPQMDKLQVDRKRYAAFKDKEVLAERLNHKIKKHEYVMKTLDSRNREYKSTALKDALEKVEKEYVDLGEKLAEADIKIKNIKTKDNSDFIKEYNQMKDLIRNQESSRNTIKTRLHNIQKQSLNLKEETAKNQQERQRLKQEIQWYEKQAIQAQKQLEQTGDLLDDLAKSTSEQEALQLVQKQIKQQQAGVVNLKEEIKMLQNKKVSIKHQTDKQHKEVQEAKGSMEEMIATVKNFEKDINDFRHMQRPIPVEDPQIGSQQLRRLQGQRKKIINENHKLAFFYNDPVPGFNRKHVKGKMFMIFKVKDRIFEKALEIGMGAKINQIVVQNEVASQMLVKAQSFGSNATLIPNNKIRYQPVKPETLRYAEDVAREYKGMAKVAYELIDYPQDLKNSIFYAFSSFVVCSSPEIARKIAFSSSRAMQCKCVTYDGDVYEPGTMTGGSDMNTQFMLPRYRDLRLIDEKIHALKEEYDHKGKQFHEYNERMSRYNNLQKDIEAKINRKEKLQQKLATLSISTKPKDYTEELQSIGKRIQVLSKQLSDQQAKVQELSAKVKKGGMKSVEQQKKAISQDKAKYQKKLSQTKKRININEVQIEQIINNMKIADETQLDCQKQIIELQKSQSKIIDEIKMNKIQFEVFEQKRIQYDKQQAMHHHHNEAMQKELQEMKRKKQESEENIKDMKQNIQELEKSVVHVERVIAALLAENPWLEAERQIEIDQDFNYDDAVKEHNQLLIDVDKLRKTVKVNVDDHSYQKLNEQYRELLAKKGTLQKDKVTLLSNMHQLDQKRTKTLENCFKIVKENLGTIFNDLLPGATAHLNLIDENDVTKGAELRVHFNNVKKELSELSGGQRSLLALSFILALLLYKPSPFYILDEIDSALDLSHTENIGYMISKRFPQSQFLLISLKEGMFQNANVLYKVHFAEGESKVDRQVLRKKK